MKRKSNRIRGWPTWAVGTLAAVSAWGLFPSLAAAAGFFEVGLQGIYSRKQYGSLGNTRLIQYGGSLGYHFTEMSGLELSFSDAVERTYIAEYQDTRTHDRLYSLSWVQAILPRWAVVQPFFKVGVGQLNREQSGTYAAGVPAAPMGRTDRITVVGTVGLKVFVTRHVALKAEATSYLNGGAIGTWKNDVNGLLGLSIYF